MKPRTKLILGNVATGVYLASALLAAVFTISLASFEGGPASMGYAAIFVLLFVVAAGSVTGIAAAGCWGDRKKAVFIAAVAWPFPIVFSAAVARALFFT